MARRATQRLANNSLADTKNAIRKTWFGVTLIQATALTLLITIYLGAIGAILRFFSKEFHTFREQEPTLFWLLLGAPVLFIGCFSVAPEAWRRIRQARRNALVLIDQVGQPPPLSNYFRLDPYVTISASDFNREDRAHERVLHWLRTSSRPLLFLSGASGSGKSSILEAYVIPMLRQQEWRVQVIRSSSSPLAALENAITARRPRTTRLLIVLDQFEEFVILEERSSAEDRQRLLQRALEIRAASSLNISILFVVRSDYLNAIIGMKLDDLISDITWCEIDPFRRGPARRFLESGSRKPSSELVDRLLDGADALDEAPGLYRPVVLNMLGLALYEFDRAVTHRPERLVQAYLERAVTQNGMREVAPKVVGKMITDQGTKIPRSISEIKQETGLTETDILFCLVRLEAKRLVRRFDDGFWEISHDFVGRQFSLLLGRLRPSPWPTVSTWTAPVFLSLALASIVAGIPLYLRQQASNELRTLGVLVSGDAQQLTAKIPTGEENNVDLRPVVSHLALIGSLQTLDVSFTGVNDLSPLKELPALQTIDLSSSEVTDISPLTGLPALQTLDLSSTKITDFRPLQGLSALQTLKLTISKITDLGPIQGLLVLKTLDLSGTEVTDLNPLQGLLALQTLNLRASRVTDVHPLKSLRALQTLDLSSTGVTDLSPLQGLSGLQALDVSDTNVTDLNPLKGLPALQGLNLSGLHLSDLSPLRELPALRTIGVSNTQIGDPGQVEELIKLGIEFVQ